MSNVQTPTVGHSRRGSITTYSRTGTPATATYYGTPPASSGSRTPSPHTSTPGSSHTIGASRRPMVVDWDIELPLEASGDVVRSFNQTFHLPSTSEHQAGTVVCQAIGDNEREGSNVNSNGFFVKVAFGNGCPVDVELKVFGQADASAPYLNHYAENCEFSDFHITARSLAPLIGPNSRTARHIPLLLSLTITLSAAQPQYQFIHETASPSVLQHLGNFLDQPGGHDVVFCFPDGKHLYADRFILQRSSPYFRRLFQCQSRGGQQTVETPTEASSKRSPGGRRYGSGQSSPVSSMRDEEDGFESEDITIQGTEDLQTPATSTAPSSSRDNYFPSADPTRIPLPRDSPNSRQNTLQRTPSPNLDDNVFLININETSFNTYRAFLYYLYSGFISFAPLTSCFHRQHPYQPSKTKSPRRNVSDENDTVEKRRLEIRNAVVNDYTRRHPSRPVPVSPKSLYAIAKKYEIPALEMQSLARIISVSETDPIVAINELFSPFSRVHTAARNVQLDTVISAWEDVVRRSGEWEAARNKGVKVADTYFATVLCEILDRLPGPGFAM